MQVYLEGGPSAGKQAQNSVGTGEGKLRTNQSNGFITFNVCGSVHHKIFINNCPTRCKNQQSIYLLQGHSTCFGCHRTHHQEYIKL